MGFDLKFEGETVHTIDVDPRLVESFTVGSYKVPVQFEQDSLDFTVTLKSTADAEYIAALRKDEAEKAATAEVEETEEVEEVEEVQEIEEETEPEEQ